VPERGLTTYQILLVEDDEEDYLLTKDLIAEVEGGRPGLSWVRDYGAALEAVRTGTFDVCLADYRLSGTHDGIDLIRALVDNGHAMPVILITGQGARNVDEAAARAGASDFLVKGEFSATLLERTIRYAIQSHRAVQELKESYRTTVRALATALEMRDDATGAHAARVTELALRLTAKAAPKLCADQQLEYGFLLHDIGKIGVADAVILKPGSLDPEELKHMQGHVALGQRIIADIPYLNGLAADVVGAHHERWDGTGYPQGLRGEEIPLAARIFSVVDAYDAMTNDRPYRFGRTAKEALEAIRAGSGTQFDPAVVTAFLDMITEAGGDRRLAA
jgi:HD-GYP domain-containing protein (c-di-GMP phosphodiesterase class II)